MATKTESQPTRRQHRFYTADEIAPMFRTSVKSIYRWAKDPEIGLPVCHTPAGGLLFEAARIDQLIELMAKDLLK